MEGRPAFALFMEMGTGKTWVAISDFGRMWVRGQIDRVLITAGKGSYRVWEYEIAAHISEQVDYALHVWDGMATARSRRDAENLEYSYDTPVLRVLVINIEALGSSARAQQFTAEFVSRGRTCIVVDESTLIKSRTATRAKFLTRIGQQATARRILTGAPVTRDPLDLWSQFEFLGPRLLRQRSFWSFQARYAIVREMNLGSRLVRKPVAFQRLPELESIVAEHSHRVLKEECLDLPEKIYETRHVEMTPEQADLYSQMRRHSVAELADGGAVMTATTAMTRVMRMHQILCGQLTDDDTHESRRVSQLRTAALVETIEEAGSDVSVIVWCARRHDVELVCETLTERWGSEQVLEYHGGTSPEDRERAVSMFQSRRARFLVATRAASKGLTLTAASLVVYYSNSYDLEDRIQSEDRAHRIGQQRSVVYVDLMVPGTIDERIVDALRRKIDVAAAVMGDGPREWLR